MKYEITIVATESENEVFFKRPHKFVGYTDITETEQACYFISTDYNSILDNVIDGGIFSLNDVDIWESLPMLRDAVFSLKGEKSENITECSTGNVKNAISELIILADMALVDYPTIAMKWKVTNV
jgi:hypothetical protein